jgi:ubiquinone/menaquinone biosynthesis C-methylase UbiE
MNEDIARFFDELSGTRNALFHGHPVLDYEQQRRAEAVLDALAARPGDAILDIGCGNARDIIAMLRAGARVVGVDLSEGMIAQASRDLSAAGYADVRLEVGDATRLQFADATFDRVLCSEVIEHIPDAPRALAEIHRVLKPGGTLAISTPNRRSWYGFDRYVVYGGLLRRRWNHPYDEWRRMSDLRALLEGAGFRVAAARTTCYMPGFLLTYFLPRPLQAAVASIARRLERPASRLAPGSGYLLVVRAVKAQ